MAPGRPGGGKTIGGKTSIGGIGGRGVAGKGRGSGKVGGAKRHKYDILPSNDGKQHADSLIEKS